MSEPLIAADLCFWDLDTPVTRHVIGAFARLDHAPDSRVLGDKLLWAVQTHPRMRQCLSDIPGRAPRWEEQTDFSIGNHLERIALPEFDDSSLFSAAAKRFTQGFDHSRPPWFLAIFTSPASTRAAVLFCVHHAFADGISGLGLFYALTDGKAAPERRAQSDEEFDAPRTTSSSALPAVRSARFRIGTRWNNLQVVLGEILARPVPSSLNGANSPIRNFTFCELPLPIVSQLRRRYRVSLNELMLGLVADAVADYETLRGHNLRDLFTLIPVNLREHRDITALGNDLTALRLRLPIAAGSLESRSKTVAATLAEANDSFAVGAYRALSRWLGRAPRKLRRRLLAAAAHRVNFICTNVPAPRSQRFLGGSLLGDTFGLPALMSGQGIAFAFIRGRKNVSIAIVSDPAICKDPETLIERINLTFAAAVAPFAEQPEHAEAIV